MNVVSFGVWGNATCYNYGVLENAIIIKDKLPDYECWVYHNNSLPKQIEELLKKVGNVHLFHMNDTNDKRNTMWRFMPAFDKRVNICLVRDADSRIEEKELKAVEEWLASDKDFHIMRDHPMHKRKILAGMWGCRNQILVHIFNNFLEYIKVPYLKSNWIVDETYLTNHIYPRVVKKAFVHASYNRYEKNARPFPKIENHGKYIGSVTNRLSVARKQFPESKLPKKLFKKRSG